MDSLVVACVRGADWSIVRVKELRDVVERWMSHPHEMVCLTDQPERCDGVSFVDISAMELTGWWMRMALFEPQWRARRKIIHLGLDVVVGGDLSPLAGVAGEFAIAGNYIGRGRFDSNAMVLGSLLGPIIWKRFDRGRNLLMSEYKNCGNSCIEALYPDAELLQRCVRAGFFRTNLLL